MNERQYIVTGKHLRKLKDKLEESYLKIEKEWLRDWLEAIEAQEGAVRICDLGCCVVPVGPMISTCATHPRAIASNWSMCAT